MSTKVTTGMVRFSYANVWEPKPINGSEPKYSVSIIIPKSAKKTLAKIEAAIEAAKEKGKESKWQGKIPGKLKLPLRDGDEEYPDNPVYKDMYFMSATSFDAPTILDADREEILNPKEFYSGCFGRANVNFYPFNANGNKGIACGLSHLQKLKDGENLTGRISADKAFEDDLDEDSFGDDDFLD